MLSWNGVSRRFFLAWMFCRDGLAVHVCPDHTGCTSCRSAPADCAPVRDSLCLLNGCRTRLLCREPSWMRSRCFGPATSIPCVDTTWQIRQSGLLGWNWDLDCSSSSSVPRRRDPCTLGKLVPKTTPTARADMILLATRSCCSIFRINCSSWWPKSSMRLTRSRFTADCGLAARRHPSVSVADVRTRNR